MSGWPASPDTDQSGDGLNRGRADWGMGRRPIRVWGPIVGKASWGDVGWPAPTSIGVVGVIRSGANWGEGL